MKRKNYTSIAKHIFYVLLIFVLLLGAVNIAQAKGWLIPAQPYLVIENGIIELNSMTLEQKIAQMVIVAGVEWNQAAWKKMQVGGVHFFAQPTEWIYNNTIIDYQYNQSIPFFITADFEGCVTPFAHLRNSTSLSDITTIGEAYQKGFEDGAYLASLGFNLNFAPVVDLDDTIWNCRSFPGTAEEIAELAEAYTLGLQTQGIIATAKHYPGKTLVGNDPHKLIASAVIDLQDTLPYDYLTNKGDIKSVMVSHIITTGAVDSNGVPSVVSSEVIADLKLRYDGLIISDEIHMLGLEDFFDTLDEMYVGVFKAGNDIILNFDNDPNEVYRMIQVVKLAIEDGVIDEDDIDASVAKILEAKGFIVG
jgi:beta-N-acetylhexosaminidase